ncbi:helix-turn-helix domain-containing protein [Variovorax sp. MHTC-1]|uniref:helix-turn-helix domain-containing protein n=1 Tax=Variovorax sp. MHTC-1 TaxID=2495593 RepID=UPI000F863CEE|nr:AraC family transcriptional regulator [Variovorax sp. MHTC-1]RST56451.1 AraC family transcriptional regulator [Variovorax sp. MHTC-1]
MELVDSCYWRDAELAGLQFTANRFRQGQIRPHRHFGFALSVSDTELHLRTSRGVTVVPPGTLMRIAPQVWHSVEARTTPWREDAMYCSFAVARCVNPPDTSREPLPVEGDAEIALFPQASAARDFIECHALLREAQRSASVDDAASGRQLVRDRLAQWIPIHPPLVDGRAAPLVVAVADAGDDRVNRLYRMIASGFHQRITLEGLAGEVGWHPVHLQRRFRNALGFTPHELLVGHRIEYARDLIAGGARVTYAAHAAGFSDQSHLHKTFLSTYAVVPGEYRRLSAFDALQPLAARNGIVE